MTNYSNENSGALFKNDRKESEKHPDYKGSINVEGVDYWLSAWIKTSTKGTKFMSLSVKPKEQQQKAAPPKKDQSGFDDMDSDLPF